MSTTEADVSKNLATVFEDIVFCARIGGFEAERGKKRNPTRLHEMIVNIDELLKQCKVLEKEGER